MRDFERSVELPERVKAEDIKPSCYDGILELTAPLPKELKQKKVKIPVEHEEPTKDRRERAQKPPRFASQRR